MFKRLECREHGRESLNFGDQRAGEYIYGRSKPVDNCERSVEEMVLCTVHTDLIGLVNTLKREIIVLTVLGSTPRPTTTSTFSAAI